MHTILRPDNKVVGDETTSHCLQRIHDMLHSLLREKEEVAAMYRRISKIQPDPKKAILIRNGEPQKISTVHYLNTRRRRPTTQKLQTHSISPSVPDPQNAREANARMKSF